MAIAIDALHKITEEEQKKSVFENPYKLLLAELEKYEKNIVEIPDTVIVAKKLHSTS